MTFYFSLLACGFQVFGSRRFAGGDEACGSRSHVDNRLRLAGGFLRMASAVICSMCCVLPRAVLAAVVDTTERARRPPYQVRGTSSKYEGPAFLLAPPACVAPGKAGNGQLGDAGL